LIEEIGIIPSDASAELDHAAIFLGLNNKIFAKNFNPTVPASRGFTSKQQQKFE